MPCSAWLRWHSAAVISPQTNPCDLAGTVSGSLLAFCNPISPGLLKVAVFGSIPIGGAGTLMKLKFTAIGIGGTSSPLTLVNFQFNEGVPGDLSTNGVVNLLGPTAAAVALSGRTLDSIGTPIGRARITLTDTNGNSVHAISNQLGKFAFENLVAGETYTVSVIARDHVFTSRTISLQESVNGFDLIAEP